MPLLTLSIWFSASVSHNKRELQAKIPCYGWDSFLTCQTAMWPSVQRTVEFSPVMVTNASSLQDFFPQNYLFWLWFPFTTPSSLVLSTYHSKVCAHCCLILRHKLCWSFPGEILTFLLSRTAFVSSPLCATAILPWRVSTTKGWQFCSSEIPEVEYLVCPIPRFDTYSFFRLSALNTWFIRPIPFGRKRKENCSVLFFWQLAHCFLCLFLVLH